MTRIPPTRPDDRPPVTIGCAQPGCRAITEVAAGHAPNLAGRWRCRSHYTGIQLRRGPTGNQPA
jgi:hypothetical protein